MAEYQAKVVEKEKTRADPTRRTTTTPGSWIEVVAPKWNPAAWKHQQIFANWEITKAEGFWKPGQPSLQESYVPQVLLYLLSSLLRLLTAFHQI